MVNLLGQNPASGPRMEREDSQPKEERGIGEMLVRHYRWTLEGYRIIGIWSCDSLHEYLKF